MDQLIPGAEFSGAFRLGFSTLARVGSTRGLARKVRVTPILPDVIAVGRGVSNLLTSVGGLGFLSVVVGGGGPQSIPSGLRGSGPSRGGETSDRKAFHF